MEKDCEVWGLGCKLWEKVEINRMNSFFFSGSTEAKLDGKNRFVLPQAMRFGLVENGVLEFSMALGLGGCLSIFRQSEMEKIVAKFQAKQHVAKYQRFFTLFFSSLHKMSCDSIGRVVLPPMLKKMADIKGEIVIAGVLNKIEIWSKEQYEKQMQELMGQKGPNSELAKMSEEAFALLEEENEPSLHVFE